MKPYLIFLFLVSIVSFSCRSYDCIDGSGVLVSKEIKVTEFTSIRNSTTLDITLRQAATNRVMLHAEDNLMDRIEISSIGGKLKINVRGGCVKMSKEAYLDISMKSLTALKLSGTGDVKGTAFLDNCKITNSGTSDINLEGSAKGDLNIQCSGTGTVNVEKIPVDAATVSCSGVGDVYVYAKDKLKVSVSGTADVYYKGNPKITKSVSGVGKLVDNNRD